MQKLMFIIPFNENIAKFVFQVKLLTNSRIMLASHPVIVPRHHRAQRFDEISQQPTFD